MKEKLSSFFNNWMKKTVIEKDISHITRVIVVFSQTGLAT